MALYQHRFIGHTSMGEQYIFSWWAESGATLAAIQAAAVSWINAFWAGGYGAQVAASVGVDGVSTGLIDQLTGRQEQRADTAVALVGSAATGPLPPDVAVVTSLRTIVANRRGRGRFYLPQPAIASVGTDGSIAAATVTAILDSLDAGFGPYVAQGTPVVYSRTGRSVAVVTSYDVGDFFDTQRRRENGSQETRTSRPMP